MPIEQILLEISNNLSETKNYALKILSEVRNQTAESNFDVWIKYHIPNFLQLCAIGAGIWTIKHQIQKQHESNLETQRESLRNDLRLQLRDQLESSIDQLNGLTAVAANFPLHLSTSFIIAKAQLQQGAQHKPIPQRIPKFNQDNGEIQSHMAEIVKLIEKSELILPELKIFQIAVNVFAYDFRKVANAYFEELLKFLPFDAADEDRVRTGISIYNRPLPNAEEEKRLKELGEAYSNALHDFGGWLMDLRIALQNLTLSHLFSNRTIPLRKPIDQTIVVIDSDKTNFEKLENYFLNETDWGMNKKVIDAEVLKKLKESK